MSAYLDHESATPAEIVKVWIEAGIMHGTFDLAEEYLALHNMMSSHFGFPHDLIDRAWLVWLAHHRS